MIDADEIFERLEKAIADKQFGDDHRNRLAFHCGMLQGEIRVLCIYLNNHEEEIKKLQTEIAYLKHQL